MKTSMTWVIGATLLAGVVGCQSEAAKALEACQATNATTTESLEVCYEAWKKYADEPEFGELTESFDFRVEDACKYPNRIKDCDEYCPKRIQDPGPKNKTKTLSMCVAKGYGTLDGKLTSKKDMPKLYGDMSPEVIEPCVVECRPLAANPHSAEYQSCFSGCKTKKIAELNAR